MLSTIFPNFPVFFDFEVITPCNNLTLYLAEQVSFSWLSTHSFSKSVFRLDDTKICIGVSILKSVLVWFLSSLAFQLSYSRRRTIFELPIPPLISELIFPWIFPCLDPMLVLKTHILQPKVTLVHKLKPNSNTTISNPSLNLIISINPEKLKAALNWENVIKFLPGFLLYLIYRKFNISLYLITINTFKLLL